jgi:hypothetical protein
MGDIWITNTQRDFLVLSIVFRAHIRWQRKCHLACRGVSMMEVTKSILQQIPSGPTTSTADTGISFLRLLRLGLGKSKKRKDTSGGTDMAALPTREDRARDEEKSRA